MTPLRNKPEEEIPLEAKSPVNQIEVIPSFEANPQKKEIVKPASLNSINALEVLKQANVDQRRGKSRMAPLLVDHGLGLDEIARKLSTFANYSEDERIQYDACKMALQLHGELDKEGDKNSPVQINFVGITPELLQVLIPRG